MLKLIELMSVALSAGLKIQLSPFWNGLLEPCLPTLRNYSGYLGSAKQLLDR